MPSSLWPTKSSRTYWFVIGIDTPVSLHLTLWVFSEYLRVSSFWINDTRKEDLMKGIFSVLSHLKTFFRQACVLAQVVVGHGCDPPGQWGIRLWMILDGSPNLYLLILTLKLSRGPWHLFPALNSIPTFKKTISWCLIEKGRRESLSALGFADSASPGINLKGSCSFPVFTFISSHIWRPKFINLSPSLTTVYWVCTLRQGGGGKKKQTKKTKRSPDLSGVKWMEKSMGRP